MNRIYTLIVTKCLILYFSFFKENSGQSNKNNFLFRKKFGKIVEKKFPKQTFTLYTRKYAFKNLCVFIFFIHCVFSLQSIIAQPKYNICSDLGDTLSFGIMANGGNEQWLQKTHFQDGVDWGLVYFYHTGIFNTVQDSIDTRYIVIRRADSIHKINAIPVVTAYKLLPLAEQYGYSGTEANKIQEVLRNPAAMKKYYETFRVLLSIMNSLSYTTICHVEPDPWGFMIWAFGIEGNNDAQSVEVKVGSSGHPDLVGFPDNASGFGQALLRLRDIYGPKVRMGWHASNFRVGTQAHITSGFYNGINGPNSGVGKWDVLISEDFYTRAAGTNWWDSWDQTIVNNQINWFKHVSSATGIPFILWQLPHGEIDYHILGNNNATNMLQKFAEAGVRAFLFDHQNFQGDNHNDPYTWRSAGEHGKLPPAGHPAGEPRASVTIGRMKSYTKNKYYYPCAGSANYCSSKGNSTNSEYIDLVKLGTIYKVSGNDGGYKNNTNLSANLYLGNSYTIQYSASINSWYPRNEHWTVWIDYNRDGDFGDAGELVAYKISNSSGTLSSTFTVPQTAGVGSTCMRISMKYGSPQYSCEQFANGEVEDYTINLMPKMGLINKAPVLSLVNKKDASINMEVYPNPVYDKLSIKAGKTFKPGEATIFIHNMTGEEVMRTIYKDQQIDVSSLPLGVYMFIIKQGSTTKKTKFMVQH